MLIGVQFQLFTLIDSTPVQHVGPDHSLEIRSQSVSLIVVTASHPYHFNQSFK